MLKRVLLSMTVVTVLLALAGCDALTAIFQPASPGDVTMEPGPSPVGGSTPEVQAAQQKAAVQPTIPAPKPTMQQQQLSQMDTMINGNSTAAATNANPTGSSWKNHVAVNGVLNMDGKATNDTDMGSTGVG